MALVQIEWRPGPPALRSFGRTVLIGSLLIATLFWLVKGWHDAAKILAAAGVVIGGLGLTGRRIALPGYWLWMGVAFLAGSIVSRVVLAVVYYLVMTPLGLLMRALRRDRLGLRPGERSTYWVDIPADRFPDDHQRQF